MIRVIQDVQREQVVELSSQKSCGVRLSRSDGDANRRVVEAQSQDGQHPLPALPAAHLPAADGTSGEHSEEWSKWMNVTSDRAESAGPRAAAFARSRHAQAARLRHLRAPGGGLYRDH